MLKEKFCSRLRTVRADRGLSQENLADMLGMSPNGYARIERGETHVSLEKVEEIAGVLEMEVADLLQIGSHNNFFTNSQGSFLHSPHGVVNLHDPAAYDKMQRRISELESVVADLVRKTN